MSPSIGAALLLGRRAYSSASRSIALTEADRDFYDSEPRTPGDFENATARIGRGQTSPKGLIRVKPGAPASLVTVS